MDDGAHFYNCDFQVHTPRDRQWSGERAISSEERENYAEEFIQACRDNGLDAVAITDHHDTVFIEHIREAARNETDENGELLPEKDRIVVFPGMELYLNVPCQALLLFDAHLPLDLLATARDRLGIEQAPPENYQTHEPEQLGQLNTLGDLYEALNGHPKLEDRFVVFPNVTDDGHRTLLRSGLKEKYINMPCVGGYIDGSIDEEMGAGALNKVRGRDPNYGNKAVGLFQTSDNRARDHEDLGEHTTWVKWAEPTAEGLRQACLARDSRLWQEEPELPSNFVKRISVSDSLFMGEFELSFNRQYTALIGGRGTGKSTVLEYLRWGLGDGPRASKEDDLSEAEKTRRELIQKTLIEPGGTVEVELSINGVSHVVRREGPSTFLLKVGDQDTENVNRSAVQDLLPIQGYSQKQLSSVPVRIDELNRFVRAPIQDALKSLNSEIESNKSSQRTVYASLQKKRKLEVDLGSVEREMGSVRQQIEEIKNKMTDLDDEDRQILDQKELYDQEKTTVENWIDEVKNIRSLLDDVQEKTAAASTTGQNGLDGSEAEDENTVAAGVPDSLPDADLLADMRERLDEVIDAINDRVRQSSDDIDELLDDESAFDDLIVEFDKRQTEFENQYASVREQADAYSEQMKRLDELESRLGELRRAYQETKDEIDEIGEPSDAFLDLRSQWRNLHRQRSELLQEQSEALTDQSKGFIRAHLEVGGQTEVFVEEFRRKMEGSNLYRSVMESIFESIPEADAPIEQYSRIMRDLERLSRHDVDEGDELPETPALDECDLDQSHHRRIAEYLTAESWLDVAVISLDDEPKFEYQVQKDQYIKFSSASAGQQATALLLALLNQSGPPLIIDQPEDDLDNQVILNVVEEIWTAKHERQLIFASHNANLVVNGDADLVACFESDMGGGEASGSIEHTGAIDVETIRNQITEIMEGGQEAFELRKEKYGF